MQRAINKQKQFTVVIAFVGVDEGCNCWGEGHAEASQALEMVHFLC